MSKEKAKVRRPIVPAEDFVEAWQTSDTRQEVADKTGLSVASASARAGWFRKQGVPLKSFRTKQIDVAALKALPASRVA